MSSIQLSKDFWLSEFTRSDTAKEKGIDNIPGPAAIENIRWMAVNVLQILRNHLGVPVTITSGFRNVKVNWLAGGVSDSDHLCRGRLAGADIRVEGKNLEEIAAAIRELRLPVKQVIIEKDQGVVHISCERPLFEFLIRSLVQGKLVYRFFEDKIGIPQPRGLMSRMFSGFTRKNRCWELKMSSLHKIKRRKEGFKRLGHEDLSQLSKDDLLDLMKQRQVELDELKETKREFTLNASALARKLVLDINLIGIELTSNHRSKE